MFVFERLLTSFKPRDTLLFLGDIAFSKEWLMEIKALRCTKKILVMGNHDTDFCSIEEIADAYDEVYSLYSRRGIWLSHAPIHPNELRGKYNVHGHTHNNNVPDGRYFNACLENTKYSPVGMNELKQKLFETNLQ